VVLGTWHNWKNGFELWGRVWGS